MADSILSWYDRHARKLPWRVGPKERARGVKPDPYRVWLSEVMLQQTTVPAVKGHFERFVSRWPDVAALAAASREDVMKEWAGLGYYARARNLKACAEAVVRNFDGRFPENAAGLEELPGIGGYTAAAIAAIAFDEPAAVVDANIERILSRVFAIETPLPAAKKIIHERQSRLMPKRRAGDYAQGLMDLGAAICTPKRPACSFCPWSDACAAHEAGTAEMYPVKAAKAERPRRYGVAFVAVRADGAVLLQRRAESGLLGGMSEVPGSEWTIRTRGLDKAAADAPFKAKWRRISSPVVHVFTHFRLELAVYRGDIADGPAAPEGAWWSPPDELPGEALPSLMKKVIEAALPGATKRRAKVA